MGIFGNYFAERDESARQVQQLVAVWQRASPGRHSEVKQAAQCIVAWLERKVGVKDAFARCITLHIPAASELLICGTSDEQFQNMAQEIDGMFSMPLHLIVKYWPAPEGERLITFYNYAVNRLTYGELTGYKKQFHNLLADECYKRLNELVTHDGAELIDDKEWKRCWWSYRVESIYRPKWKGARQCPNCPDKRVSECWQWYNRVGEGKGYAIHCRWCDGIIGYYVISHASLPSPDVGS